MQNIFKFELKTRVKDITTNVSGVIICRAEYSDSRPNDYLLTFKDATGRPCEWWVPEERLVLCYE